MKIREIRFVDGSTLKKGTLFMRKTDTFPEFDLGFISKSGQLLGEQDFMFSSKKVIYIELLSEREKQEKEHD